MAKEIEIEAKVNGLAKIKQDLKELKGELINATDPKEIDRLSQAAGELSDKIADASEKIKVFSAGSDFEKVSNGLGLVGSQLSSLDFEGAAESAKTLTSTIKNMDPKAVAQGFKDFTSTIGQLSNAFVQMGIKLLMNPIFLFAAIIAGVVIAIVLLKDKVKILEQAFDLMMTPVRILIQGLKDLSDWLGFTSFAAEESADKQITANNKLKDSYKKTNEASIDAIDKKIRLLKAEGKDTEQAELQKQDVIIRGAKKQLETARTTYAELDALRKNGRSKLSEDQRKALEESAATILEEKKIISDAEFAKLELVTTNNTKEREETKKHHVEKKKIVVAAKVDLNALLEKENKENFDKEVENLSNETKRQIDIIEGLAFQRSLIDADSEVERTMIRQQKAQEELDALKLTGQAKLDAQSIFNATWSDNMKKAAEDDKKTTEDAAAADEEIKKRAAASREAYFRAGSAALKQAAQLLGETTDAGKAAAIAAATIDTYQSAVSSYNSLSGIPVVGPALGFAAAGIAVAAGIANVKKIMSVKTPRGGGGGSAPSASSQPTMPSGSLFGAQSNNNTVTGAKSVEAAPQQNILVRAVVSETEISATQNRISSIERSAEL